MSQPAIHQPQDLRTHQAVEAILACVREGFNGSVEIQFRDGRPTALRKTVTVQLGRDGRDLIRRG